MTLEIFAFVVMPGLTLAMAAIGYAIVVQATSNWPALRSLGFKRSAFPQPIDHLHRVD
jgi:hypothetical protein